MILINVPQDGNCLFRCLYIYLNRKQRTYERFKNGKIRKRTIDKEESDDSNELRQDIIDYVENNKDKTFIDQFNKDPLVKEPLVSYWCQRHEGWHVSKESNKICGDNYGETFVG